MKNNFEVDWRIFIPVKKSELYSSLWEACDELRGGVEPARYKDYVLENRFLKLKGWRGIATRYAKTTSSYKASVQICCFFMWLNIL